jgi:ribosomal protein S12 methylthiotransferase accessory factor
MAAADGIAVAAAGVRDRELERRRLDRLLGLFDHLVDSRVGVIGDVYELRTDDDEPSLFHYLTTVSDTGRFATLTNFRTTGGVSTSRYVAIAKGIGEAVERYCSAVFDYHALVYDTAEGLGEIAVSPEAFALYRPEQLESGRVPWQPFTRTSPLAWTMGTSLVSGRRLMVPAAMVYVPFHYVHSRPDTPIAQPISTGLACHCSFAEAAVSGLCEVIERDAFTITWQAELSRPRIAARTLPESAGELLRRFAEVGLAVEVMEITTDIEVPTLLTIALTDATTSPALTVAAAADPSPEVALIKSLEELAHTRKFARQLMQYTPELPVDVDGGHPAVQTQDHHLRFYCPQHAKPLAKFTWSSAERRDFPEATAVSSASPEAQLEAIVEELDRAGLDAIGFDLTTPDIAACGLSVVRVVVPGAHPLFMGYANRALGGNRLYSVPQKLGYRGLEPGRPDNPYPHPFP